MMNPLNEEKVFKDPVHNYIHVQDMTIWRLINTIEFQRLRRIRQLGTSYLTFHGAEHSRFSHSLGVYEITRQIISLFERNDYSDWPKEEKLLTLCAALLHDLGHGPFSHSIEEAFDMNHEDWTIRILLGNTQIHDILSEVSCGFADKVASVIARTYHKPIVVNLVSSALDADRMDYLLRDAYYTGVNYGTIDIDRIIRVLRPHQGRIVVKESGMHAVEDYLMARYQMYWQVYFHPVTRSSEIILKLIFIRARELYNEGYTFEFMMAPLVNLFEDKMTVEQYLKLDEALIQTVFMQWSLEKDPILSELCSRFMHRRLYKYVELEPHELEMVHEVIQVFRQCGLNPDYDVAIDSPSDLPYDVFHSGDEVSQKQILLLDRQERLMEISEVSDIVRSISGLQRGKFRLYYPEEKINALISSFPKAIAHIFTT